MVKYSYQGKTKNEQKKEKEYVKKICQSAQSRRNLHTHTHTGKLLPSLKQIGTICFTTILSLFISPSYSYITNSSGCNQGVLQTDTGPAALEANYSANTINTKWYSDGTQLTGTGIPGTCTYDNALSLPASQTKPGYDFGGWRIKAPAPITLSDLLNETATNYGYAGHEHCYWDDDLEDTVCDGYAPQYNVNIYDFSAPHSWGVSFGENKIIGKSGCAMSYYVGEFAHVGTFEDAGTSGFHCICKMTAFVPNMGVSQIHDGEGDQWIFAADMCENGDCSMQCANLVQGNLEFRESVFELFGR